MAAQESMEGVEQSGIRPIPDPAPLQSLPTIVEQEGSAGSTSSDDSDDEDNLPISHLKRDQQVQ